MQTHTKTFDQPKLIVETKIFDPTKLVQEALARTQAEAGFPVKDWTWKEEGHDLKIIVYSAKLPPRVM